MINVLPSKKKKTPLMVRKPGKTSEILPLEQIFLTKILIWLLHINLQQVECPSPPQKPSLKNHKVTCFLVYNILADFKGLNIQSPKLAASLSVFRSQYSLDNRQVILLNYLFQQHGIRASQLLGLFYGVLNLWSIEPSNVTVKQMFEYLHDLLSSLLRPKSLYLNSFEGTLQCNFLYLFDEGKIFYTTSKCQRKVLSTLFKKLNHPSNIRLHE